MMKTLLSTAAALSLVACVQEPSDPTPQDIDHALPQANQVAIKLPGGQARSAAARASEDQNVVGQLATWYVATRDATRTFNGGSGLVLGLIHAIVQFPVTSVKDDVMTWGPWSDALDPGQYKLDVKVIGDGTYEYTLSGRSKLDANAQFEALITGTADPRAGELKGSGAFKLDFDAMKRVNPIENANAQGKLEAHYDLAKHHLDLVATALDALGQPIAVNYAYDDDTQGGGNMAFGLIGNAGGGANNESIVLRSRWLATGAGRSDARVSGGDLINATATASECWDTSFKRVFYIDAISSGGTLSASEGSEAACAFATAQLPPL